MTDDFNPYKHEGWIANLSDGTTAYEGKVEPGQRTPWQQLLQTCRDKGVSITALRLQRGGVTVMAMPHKQCNGYFQARESVRIMFKNIDMLKYGIGSIVDDKVFITWLELKPNGSPYIYNDVRSLAENKIHTTLQEA